MRMTVCKVLAVSVAALLAASCANLPYKMAPVTKEELGEPFSEKPQRLYAGELMVQGFSNGFRVMHKDGQQVVIVLKENTPHLQPYGYIGRAYKMQGGAEVFGEPMEGEMSVLGKYRVHVFERALIFWQSGVGVESALFSTSFNR